MVFSTDQKVKLKDKSYECTSEMTLAVRVSMVFLTMLFTTN